MGRAVDLLAAQMQGAHRVVAGRLAGLSDDEFLWEPEPGCWTVRRRADGSWTLDYALPDPDPPPVTTIAWRLLHIASCKVMYHDHAFGRGRLDWDHLAMPHEAAPAIAWLEEGHGSLTAALAGLDDGDLDEPRRTNWGELWPTWRIFWAMIHEETHHGAEIGVLRDLYRAQRG